MSTQRKEGKPATVLRGGGRIKKLKTRTSIKKGGNPVKRAWGKE